MKKNLTTLARNVQQLKRTSFMLLLLSLLFTTRALSQKADGLQELGDLTSQDWKPTPDLNAAIATEQVKINSMLAAPALPATDRSLFLCYQRMLSYVQAEITGGNAVDAAILSSYEKVLVDAATEPDLKQLPLHGLSAMLPELLEALTALPVAAPAQAN
ncbi:MAG: hypothetical protein H6574_17115 [Lewinellaceae bacterium]|nr:hypothetical protein [Lewinellaceae bacterium]